MRYALTMSHCPLYCAIIAFPPRVLVLARALVSTYHTPSVLLHLPLFWASPPLLGHQYYRGTRGKCQSMCDSGLTSYLARIFQTSAWGTPIWPSTSNHAFRKCRKSFENKHCTKGSTQRGHQPTLTTKKNPSQKWNPHQGELNTRKLEDSYYNLSRLSYLVSWGLRDSVIQVRIHATIHSAVASAALLTSALFSLDRLRLKDYNHAIANFVCENTAVKGRSKIDS